MSTKTVLITGASRSIGLELAKEYKGLGWNVIGAVRSPDSATQLKELSPYKVVRMDMKDESSILDAAKSVESEPIDLLINNAGILYRRGFQDTTKEDMMEQFEVNVTGPFLTTRAFLPNLKEAVKQRGEAKVVQISSYLGSIELAPPSTYGYNTSKAGVNMVQKCISQDFKDEKITTVSLHPGYVATDMNDYKGVVKVTDSAKGLVSVIQGLTHDNTGKFFDYTGAPLPW